MANFPNWFLNSKGDGRPGSGGDARWLRLLRGAADGLAWSRATISRGGGSRSGAQAEPKIAKGLAVSYTIEWVPATEGGEAAGALSVRQFSRPRLPRTAGKREKARASRYTPEGVPPSEAPQGVFTGSPEP